MKTLTTPRLRRTAHGYFYRSQFWFSAEWVDAYYEVPGNAPIWLEFSMDTMPDSYCLTIKIDSFLKLFAEGIQSLHSTTRASKKWLIKHATEIGFKCDGHPHKLYVRGFYDDGKKMNRRGEQ